MIVPPVILLSFRNTHLPEGFQGDTLGSISRNKCRPLFYCSNRWLKVEDARERFLKGVALDPTQKTNKELYLQVIVMGKLWKPKKVSQGASWYCKSHLNGLLSSIHESPCGNMYSICKHQFMKVISLECQKWVGLQGKFELMWSMWEFSCLKYTWFSVFVTKWR